MSGVAGRQIFPPAPSSASQARRFVESVLAEPELAVLSYTATMLVSELVTNAVLHARTPIEVVVGRRGGRVRIEVHDGLARLPVRKHYSSMSGTGRGLLLVERMAEAWGAEPTEAGKVVWFEVDASSTPALDLIDVESL